MFRNRQASIVDGGRTLFFLGLGNNFELLEQHTACDSSLISHYVQQSNDIAGFKKTKPQELSIL